MKLLTEKARVRCDHDGFVKHEPSQGWVTVDGVPLLRHDDPEGREITGCPNFGANQKSCQKTLEVAKGYSTWVTIGREAVVLDSLEGLTDGTLPGTVHYTVRDPGQGLVGADR